MKLSLFFFCVGKGCFVEDEFGVFFFFIGKRIVFFILFIGFLVNYVEFIGSIVLS